MSTPLTARGPQRRAAATVETLSGSASSERRRPSPLNAGGSHCVCVCEVKGGWREVMDLTPQAPAGPSTEERRAGQKNGDESRRRISGETSRVETLSAARTRRIPGCWGAPPNPPSPSTPPSLPHLLPVFYIPLPPCRHVRLSPCVLRLSGPAARDKATINCGGCAEGT